MTANWIINPMKKTAKQTNTRMDINLLNNFLTGLININIPSRVCGIYITVTTLLLVLYFDETICNVCSRNICIQHINVQIYNFQIVCLRINIWLSSCDEQGVYLKRAIKKNIKLDLKSCNKKKKWSEWFKKKNTYAQQESYMSRSNWSQYH